MKKILIIGPLGQDGKLLSNILENDKYEKFGVCRVDTQHERIKLHEKKFDIKLICSDFRFYYEVEKVLNLIKPNIIVNFCGVTNVFNPWENLNDIFENNCKIPLNIMEYIRKNDNNIFFFQSSSSLMYGRSKEKYISENTNYEPIYPYGISKLYTHNLINEYRKNFNLKFSSGIFFNHDSPYRGDEFLTKKVAKFVSNILKGEKEVLKLGNLSSKRDISHALDFMLGVKLIIDNGFNEDYIFSSSKLIEIKNLVELFFVTYNLDYRKYVVYDDKLTRNDDYIIYGDNTKLKSSGWNPTKTINDLVIDMVEFELNN